MAKGRIAEARPREHETITAADVGALPAEMLADPKPLAVTMADFGQAPATKRKSIWELWQEFYEALGTHPDARILGADQGTRPNQHEMFEDATREEQRVVFLRFLMRWPTKPRR